MMDILFVLAMLAPMVVSAIFNLWPLFSVFLVFNIIFGGIEIASKRFTGSTVSQSFWKFSKGNKVKAWIMLGVMALMWGSLLVHLGSKLF